MLRNCFVQSLPGLFHAEHLSKCRSLAWAFLCRMFWFFFIFLFLKLAKRKATPPPLSPSLADAWKGSACCQPIKSPKREMRTREVALYAFLLIGCNLLENDAHLWRNGGGGGGGTCERKSSTGMRLF